MPHFTSESLKTVKESVSKKIFLRYGDPKVEITVHTGSCGIAAGAREVMAALISHVAEAKREDIFVLSKGCMGSCTSEPNVTVEVVGKAPVLYHKMTPEKMAQVFKKHVMEGEVQTDFTRA